MKKINAWEETIEINGEYYTITLIEVEGTYETYIDDGTQPMFYMFGTLKQYGDEHFAMEIAIANAPYYTRFLDVASDETED